jgi:iron complex transport system substrate-binding protein
LNTDYISSEKHENALMGKIKSWEKRNLNTEVLIDMQPDLIVGFGLNNSNPLWIFYKKWFKSDVQWRLDGTIPLGKAEWIKFWCYTDSIPRRIQSLAKLRENTTLLWL